MLTETPYSAPDGRPFRLLTLRNSAGMVVTMMDWGATLLSCRVPMADGRMRETLLGCPGPKDYLYQTAFLGASIGRYANRIAGGRYRDGGRVVRLQINQGKNQLHGGPEGFDKRRWVVNTHNDGEVVLTLGSADGDQGFPGHFRAEACYCLEQNNTLSITYRGETDKSCPVNLTSHAYFNLEPDRCDARDHLLKINAEYYLPVDRQGIPSRTLTPVTGTGFDFRALKPVRQNFLDDADQRLVNGYDHGFLLMDGGDITQPAAELWTRDQRLQLKLFTDAPALQFYSGNYLAGTPARKAGCYGNWQGIALESGLLADSPNHPEWPQPAALLSPGALYTSTTRWHFISHP